MTDAELKDWGNPNRDVTDKLYGHFDAWGRWDWCEIADEARRVNNVMFDEGVEDGSARGAVFRASIAHAEEMAYAAVAAAMGVERIYLRFALAAWFENQDNCPPPVTANRLMEMVEEEKQEYLQFLAAKGIA